MADYIKPVIFRLGNQQFGVDINLVQSIEREINIVRVPNAMKYISGIVNLRGEVIPAFSLRKKFGTDDNVGVIGEDSTVIVNIPGVVKLALEVDEVLTGIRVIKYYCWEKPFKGKIHDIRKIELKKHANMGYLMGTGIDTFMTLIPNIVPLVCFS